MLLVACYKQHGTIHDATLLKATVACYKVASCMVAFTHSLLCFISLGPRLDESESGQSCILFCSRVWNAMAGVGMQLPCKCTMNTIKHGWLLYEGSEEAIRA